MVEIIKSQAPNANVIAAIESRGFLFGPIIALKLELPFIPCRKSGKLPGPITSVEYDLEYGTVSSWATFSFTNSSSFSKN